MRDGYRCEGRGIGRDMRGSFYENQELYANQEVRGVRTLWYKEVYEIRRFQRLPPVVEFRGFAPGGSRRWSSFPLGLRPEIAVLSLRRFAPNIVGGGTVSPIGVCHMT